MEASKFLELAHKLAALDKAGARSATSRAYYAIFHEARLLIEKIGGQSCGGPSAHSLVVNYLLTVNHLTAKAAGQLLSDLQGDRIKADYRLADSEIEKEERALENVGFATEAQRLLKEYQLLCQRDEECRNELKTAIQKVNSVRRIK